MIEKHITTVLSAEDFLRRLIDPEGILANGRISSLALRLSEDQSTFAWKTEIKFSNEDTIKVHGHFNASSENSINNCTYIIGQDKIDIPLNPSESLLKSLEDLIGLPGRMKANIVRIGQEGANKQGVTKEDGLQIIHSSLYVLFWGVDGENFNENRHLGFNEIIFILKTDASGQNYKNDIIGCKMFHDGQIKVRVSVDMYGLSSHTIALEKKMRMGAISSYCYTDDFTGRKVPSLKLALEINERLSDNDTMKQRTIKNKLRYPKKEKPVTQTTPLKINTDTAVKSVISAKKKSQKKDMYQYPKPFTNKP